MSNTSTPRTDAEEYVEGSEQISVVPSIFARQLERELAREKVSVEELKRVVAELTNDRARLERELAEAKTLLEQTENTMEKNG